MDGVKRERPPTIEGRRIRLRRLHESDIAQRALLGKVPDISRGFGGDLSRPEPLTLEQARKQLVRANGDGVHWVIALRDDDRFIGTTRLDRIDVANRAANFAIGIYDPDLIGKGIGTEATTLVLQFGFGQLDLHRVSLTVLADNARAIAAYRKCGFEVEGRLRHTLRRDDAWHDDLVMAVLQPGFASKLSG